MSSRPRASSASIDHAETCFVDAWPRAQVAFSPYTRLAPPILCRTQADERREQLSGSFAMIRMRDERIVIGLREIAERGLAEHAHAILSHEVGHYVFVPSTLRDHVRLHDRIRRMLTPELASHAGLVANLYADLLLNDRLQRKGGADIAAVYAAMKGDASSDLWSFYMRSYERLWLLRPGTLTEPTSPAIDADAELAARVLRTFRERWLEGAPSFALLVSPYLESLPTETRAIGGWMDTAGTSIGDQIPDGLIEDEFDRDSIQHPAVDERLSDGDLDAEEEGDDTDGTSLGRGGGRPRRDTSVRKTRGPAEWLDTLKAVGVHRDPKDLLASYYRELAMPHLLPFPAQKVARAGDPLPEGLDVWEAGSSLESIDWFATLAKSPVVIPGVTTVERTYGVTDGGEPGRLVPDLYVGIDCSGSMGNPALQIAYPIVAGVVLALSALRRGARVMVCLSGEWHGAGRFVETPGFIRDERAILGVLTDYLGTGASFGLPRLAEAFATKKKHPVHALVVSDSDLFGEIEGTQDGWEIAKRAVEHAGAGASAVLRLRKLPAFEAPTKKLEDAGFTPYFIESEPELVSFARAFARRTFGPT